MPDNAPVETFNPARAAVQAGIPASTLRLWAKTYAAFLSPGCNPAPGEERRFTAADVEVMRAVAQLRANGLMPDDITARLRANPAEPLQMAVQTPTAPLERVTESSAQHDAIQAFLARTETAAALESLDRRLERVESQRNTVLIAVACFVGGGVFVAVVAWLASIVR